MGLSLVKEDHPQPALGSGGFRALWAAGSVFVGLLALALLGFQDLECSV